MNLFDLNYSDFSEYVSNIKYGYIDKKGTRHYDIFTNPTDDYFLQQPKQLSKSNIGLCFDIVEMYRGYLTSKGIPSESYYLEYNDNEVLETHVFIIQRKKNNLWYECIDNSWVNKIYPRGYFDKELLLKSVYEWFQSYIESIITNVDKTKFYMNKYSLPSDVFNGKTSLRSFCINRDYLNTHRLEYSGMAIVYCKGKVLVLETKHSEYVFPKGHIELGENSKDASIRECLEESGISIANAKYYGECGQYSYTFSPGHLRITNDDYFKTFGVNSITKNIYVHVYEIDSFQSFTLESIFIRGFWVDIDKIPTTITHDNTRDVFSKSLELYKQNHEK